MKKWGNLTTISKNIFILISLSFLLQSICLLSFFVFERNTVCTNLLIKAQWTMQFQIWPKPKVAFKFLCLWLFYSANQITLSYCLLIDLLCIRYRIIFSYKPDPMPNFFRHTLMWRIQNLDLFWGPQKF